MVHVARIDRDRSDAVARGLGALVLVTAALLPACGGGGGSTGQGNGASINDPVIPLVGSTGQYSMTPTEANQNRGIVRPPVMPPSVQNGQNQYLRLEVPFKVNRKDILTGSPVYAPFSYLNGNLTITDEFGNHILGIAIVNGVDAFGKNRTKEVGFPHDLTAAGTDRNVGPGVILYIADDGDGDLATIAAFGGTTTDSDSRADTTDITQIRVGLATLNGRPINAFYTVTVNDGTTGDTTGPKVLSVTAETPNPQDPLNPASAAQKSRFIVQFSEPCVPTTVGKSAKLDGTPFLGNLPLIEAAGIPPLPPLPDTYISASITTTSFPLFLPCDVTPLNSNNLATYVVTPLVDLPANRQVDVVEVDANANRNPSTQQPVGAMDLSGNLHTPGAEERDTFGIGPGRAPVNAPVSPEVLYWLPVSGNGMGAVDLNGFGFTTNTPGANAADWRRAAIITKHNTTAKILVENIDGGIAIIGHPGNGAHNAYSWPVGTGSFIYGPGIDAVPGYPWEGTGTDTGNPGTPIPGINEMSSGYETLVRNAEGDVILTGRSFSDVGPIADMVVGEFLDAGIFDTQSIFNFSTFHASIFFGGALSKNSIGEPPSPNPPPSRYWVGLNPVDVLIDQNDPLATARVIEGEEVWAGDKSAVSAMPPTTSRSYSYVIPNQSSPIGFDQDAPPGVRGFDPGPMPQSGTMLTAYSARQQVGNYLYAVDTLSKQLHVINSNTFETITSINLPDPAGVAVHPSSRYVFVSNSGDDSMSVIGADPTQPDFHQEIARVNVGSGPTVITCEPDGEDVFVANGDNTISIVQLGTLTVRKTIDSLVDGVRDIVCSPRQNGFGWGAGVYFAYIANFAGNSVVVYESGPDGPQGVGCNNVLGALPRDSDASTIFEPRGMCYCPFPDQEGFYAGGVYIANRDNQGTGLITRIEFTHQALWGALPCVLPPGRFFIPPGFNVRNFEITGQWGVTDGSRLIASKPSSVVLADFRNDMYHRVPSAAPNNSDRGTPGFGGQNSRHPIRFVPGSDPRSTHVPAWEPDRMYIAFEDDDRIQVIDPADVNVSLGELEHAGVGIKRLISYFSSQ